MDLHVYIKYFFAFLDAPEEDGPEMVVFLPMVEMTIRFSNAQVELNSPITQNVQLGDEMDASLIRRLQNKAISAHKSSFLSPLALSSSMGVRFKERKGFGGGEMSLG